MKLSACIVVYNGYDEALKAAQTVLHCTRRYPMTLYLVDNASPDGSGKSWQQVRASRWWCTAAPRTAALAPAII